MQIAPIPTNEAERLQELERYKILDTPPEGTFDNITTYAASLFNVPIALISLVDKDRQWFKSCVGLNTTHIGRTESFSSHAILDTKLFMVEDALQDIRFKDNPLVTGKPYIRFYAGFPLISSAGYALGTLCLIDRIPRKLTVDGTAQLERLGKIVMSRIKIRLSNLVLQKITEQINLEK